MSICLFEFDSICTSIVITCSRYGMCMPVCLLCILQCFVLSSSEQWVHALALLPAERRLWILSFLVEWQQFVLCTCRQLSNQSECYWHLCVFCCSWCGHTCVCVAVQMLHRLWPTASRLTVHRLHPVVVAVDRLPCLQATRRHLKECLPHHLCLISLLTWPMWLLVLVLQHSVPSEVFERTTPMPG